ncbi:hypothetical protein LSAT2_004538 [Lamellibrachia satsuma]|nr:hypothetical protein LSAT2_004538 [Lamellibrachia satsuma]
MEKRESGGHISCCVDHKLFIYQHTLTAYVRYDTCNLELTIGFNEWTASFKVFEEDFIKEDNVNLLKEANILKVVHMYLKIEKTKNILKGKHMVDADGVERFNNMFHENSMLHIEHNNLRMRVETIQQTVDAITAKTSPYWPSTTQQ